MCPSSNSSVVSCYGACCAAPTGSYDELVNYVTFGDWIFFGATAATRFVFRRRDVRAGASAVRSSFLPPFYPWSPLLFCLAALYVVVSALGTSPQSSLLAAGFILLGIPVFALWRARSRSARALRRRKP